MVCWEAGVWLLLFNGVQIRYLFLKNALFETHAELHIKYNYSTLFLEKQNCRIFRQYICLYFCTNLFMIMSMVCFDHEKLEKS